MYYNLFKILTCEEEGWLLVCNDNFAFKYKWKVTTLTEWKKCVILGVFCFYFEKGSLALAQAGPTTPNVVELDLLILLGSTFLLLGLQVWTTHVMTPPTHLVFMQISSIQILHCSTEDSNRLSSLPAKQLVFPVYEVSEGHSACPLVI